MPLFTRHKKLPHCVVYLSHVKVPCCDNEYVLVASIEYGAIQIIRGTFLAYFRPPPLPHVTFGDLPVT